MSADRLFLVHRKLQDQLRNRVAFHRGLRSYHLIPYQAAEGEQGNG